ncbi:cobalamin-independent synthase, Catalytic domain protein [Mycobacterium avium subsp. avium 2285 (R)]|nr:cobalamin-independent synthase, Catalytic domain protein [Mycobacterium avium subsp. avium 2285 (R)]
MSAFARPFATASGVGSWPGTVAREAAEVVVGELAGALAHIVELPARGVGADMLGRAGALLVDVAIDTVPRGYRLVARPGAVTRRAISLLDEDMDALEEAWEAAGLRNDGRVVKVQAPGPSRWPPRSSWPTGTGRSPTPGRCAIWRPRWARAWPRTARGCPAASRRRWWSSSTSRRCRRRWAAGCPGDRAQSGAASR